MNPHSLLKQYLALGNFHAFHHVNDMNSVHTDSTPCTVLYACHGQPYIIVVLVFLWCSDDYKFEEQDIIM